MLLDVTIFKDMEAKAWYFFSYLGLSLAEEALRVALETKHQNELNSLRHDDPRFLNLLMSCGSSHFPWRNPGWVGVFCGGLCPPPLPDAGHGRATPSTPPGRWPP